MANGCACPAPKGAVRCPFTRYVNAVEWMNEKHAAGWTQTKCEKHGQWPFWWPPDDR